MLGSRRATAAERGFEVHAVDLPSCCPQPDERATFADDAATVRSALDEIGRPAVVVGHSYGGLVITEGAAGHPNVRHLVYLAAFMPDLDEGYTEAARDRT